MINLSLKHGNYKLQLKIERIVMETELQNKRDKSKLKREIKNIGAQLKYALGLILHNTLLIKQLEVDA